MKEILSKILKNKFIILFCKLNYSKQFFINLNTLQVKFLWNTEPSQDSNLFTLITTALSNGTGYFRDINHEDICSLNKSCIQHKGELLTNVGKLVVKFSFVFTLSYIVHR